MLIGDRVEVVMKAGSPLQMFDVLHRAGGEVIDDIDLIAPVEVGVGQM
jgi:hypothetical protein